MKWSSEVGGGSKGIHVGDCGPGAGVILVSVGGVLALVWTFGLQTSDGYCRVWGNGHFSPLFLFLLEKRKKKR